jgi:hypothetical protein
MKKPSKTADLLRVLGQKAPAAASHTQSTAEAHAPKTRTARLPSRSTAPARPAPKRVRGKSIHFWLHDEDLKLIREIAVWLLPHRRRVNDSLIIKTILRAAKTGPALLAAYDQAIKIDGRSQVHKNAPK